jgi:galactokinase/mevalonate kinase-like predicted kinase
LFAEQRKISLLCRKNLTNIFFFYSEANNVSEILATAPGRCGIVGNPSDMYGGCVLACTVQERATCRLATGGDGLTIENDDESATLTTPDDLRLRGDKLDIVRAALTWFQVDPATARFTLYLSTEIPMRAGMAGSTALLAAIVGALDAYFDQRQNPYALAETTRKIESRIMGIVCGLQDQHMAVFGGLNFMDFAGKEMLQQRDDEPLVTIEPLAALHPEPPLLLAHTGIQHHSGTVHKSPRERWLAGEPLVRRNYAHLAELALRGKRALIEQDWPRLGALMDENHALVSELGGSGPANDYLIEAARKAGAWGAKLAGAGGGGTIIALTDDRERVGKALLDAGAECLLYPAPQPGLTVVRRD